MHKEFVISLSTRPINVSVKKQLNNFNVHALATFTMNMERRLAASRSLSISELRAVVFRCKISSHKKKFLVSLRKV